PAVEAPAFVAPPMSSEMLGASGSAVIVGAGGATGAAALGGAFGAAAAGSSANSAIGSDIEISLAMSSAMLTTSLAASSLMLRIPVLPVDCGLAAAAAAPAANLKPVTASIVASSSVIALFLL